MAATEPPGADATEEALSAPTATAGADRLRRRVGFGPVQLRQLMDQASEWISGRPQEARRLLEMCRLLGPTLGVPDAEPSATYLLARLDLQSGRADEALAGIDSARQGWLRLGRHLDAARTDLGRMHVLDDLGRHHEAVEIGQRLLGDLDRLPTGGTGGGDGSDLALAHWLRAAAHENVGVALGLTGHHDEALRSYEQAEQLHHANGDDGDLARVRGNRGVELTATGRAAEAMTVLASAAGLFDGRGEVLSAAMCHSNMVEAEILLGRYADALDRYHCWSPTLVEQQAWPELCRLQLRAGRAFLALNLLSEAESVSDDTRAKLTELGLRHDQARADWLAATVQLRMGRLDRALLLANGAVDGAVAVADPLLHVRVLLVRAEILDRLGDREAAQADGTQGLDLVASGQWPAEEALVRLLLAHLTADETARARHLAQARSIAQSLGHPHLQYQALLEAGRHERQHRHLDQAQVLLTGALGAVEQMRWQVPDVDVRASFLEHRTEAHAELIGLLLDRGGPDAEHAAFVVAERAKARALGDVLAGGLTHDPAVSARLVPLGVGDDLERPLPRRWEQVVEYHVVDGRLAAFVWSAAGLRVVPHMAPVDAVAGLVHQWDLQLRRRLLDNRIAAQHRHQLLASAGDILHRLWRAVFEPVAAVLDPVRRELVVVPHGPLHAVPFHALPDADARPVGDRWDVTLAPSYAVADQMRPRRRRVGRSLVVGVPDRLAPAVRAEAEAVAAVVPGAILLVGDDATADAVTELAPGCDLIHLACHGRHLPANPMYSSLRLADRSLTAREVQGLALDGPLVVLSACDSGRQGGGGDIGEPIGFSRSFVAAGASAVVVSLWLTADKPALDLMPRFYQFLDDGLPVAEALGRARRALAGRHPHPADWGAFAVHGPAPSTP